MLARVGENCIFLAQKVGAGKNRSVHVRNRLIGGDWRG
jgi:hypothetical protein